MAFGKLAGVGIGYSVTTPAGVMRPMLLPVVSANHKFPSGPSAMSPGALPVPGIGKSLDWPVMVMVPIRFAIGSVNHMLPSGPLMMPPVCAPCGAPYSVYPPDGIIFPIPCCLVYQTLPSGPGLMATGPMLVTLVLYSEMLAPLTVMAPFALGPVFWCKNHTRPSAPEEIPPGL